MSWRPIATYDQIGKKAFFADEDGFIFVGEGNCERYRGLEFTDYLDYYEPTLWMEIPPLPTAEKLVLTRQTVEELNTARKPKGKSLNRFNIEAFKRMRDET